MKRWEGDCNDKRKLVQVKMEENGESGEKK
jgi:hypothetical protein